MVITVDVSKLPSHLRTVLIGEMQLEYKDRLVVSEVSPSDPHSFTLTEEENVHNMKRRLQDILIKNKMRDYVIVLDPPANDIIRILERATLKIREFITAFIAGWNLTTKCNSVCIIEFIM
jgi:hypothetical protein